MWIMHNGTVIKPSDVLRIIVTKSGQTYIQTRNNAWYWDNKHREMTSSEIGRRVRGQRNR